MVARGKFACLANPSELCQTIAGMLNFAFQTIIHLANRLAAAGAFAPYPTPRRIVPFLYLFPVLLI
jgi:hypothetical protein